MTSNKDIASTQKSLQEVEEEDFIDGNRDDHPGKLPVQVINFIDFTMGADSGYIRFEEAEAVQKARAAAVLAEEGGLIVKNYVATLDPVTGEAEKEYWVLLRGNQERYKGNRGRGGKSNRGGRQFNGKHSRSRENDHSNRPNKVQKVGKA